MSDLLRHESMFNTPVKFDLHVLLSLSGLVGTVASVVRTLGSTCIIFS